jgi:hypothetical protein
MNQKKGAGIDPIPAPQFMPDLVEFKHIVWIRVAQAILQVFVVVEGGAARAEEVVSVYPIRLGALQIALHLMVPWAGAVVVLDTDPIMARL